MLTQCKQTGFSDFEKKGFRENGFLQYVSVSLSKNYYLIQIPEDLKSGIICVTKIVFEYLLNKMIANTFFTTHRQCTGMYVSLAMSTTAG